jgi:hypothetical protein
LAENESVVEPDQVRTGTFKAFISRISFPNTTPLYTEEAISHFEVGKTALKKKIEFSSYIRKFRWE